MEGIIQALLPIFLLIALGYTFKRIKFPNKEFWPQADKFTYYVLFPSLLIYKLSSADLKAIDGFAFVSSALITLVSISLILVVLNKLFFKFDGASFTSVYQGATRFNTYVFFALTSAILGDKGLILGAFLITFLIPVINIFCITSFSFYVSSSKMSVFSFFKSIIKNPLILACLIGGSINFFGISLPSFFIQTLDILSSAALPLGLLSVGVGLHLGGIKDLKSELLVANIMKLFLFPIIIFFVGRALGVEGLTLSLLIVFSSMPTASSSYILARELGGNLSLMSAIITIQTLVSMLSISIILMLFKQYL